MEQSLKAGPLVSVHFTMAPSQMSRDQSCSVLHNLPAAGISVPSALSAIILWLPSTLKFSLGFVQFNHSEIQDIFTIQIIQDIFTVQRFFLFFYDFQLNLCNLSFLQGPFT